MAIYGRALRQQAQDRQFEAAHGTDLQLMRRLDREFAEQAVRDRKLQYPVLTGANVQDAMDFQNLRIEWLRGQSEPYQDALARVRQGLGQ